MRMRESRGWVGILLPDYPITRTSETSAKLSYLNLEKPSRVGLGYSRPVWRLRTRLLLQVLRGVVILHGGTGRARDHSRAGAVLSSATSGYVRVSTQEQTFDLQLGALKKAGRALLDLGWRFQLPSVHSIATFDGRDVGGLRPRSSCHISGVCGPMSGVSTPAP